MKTLDFKRYYGIHTALVTPFTEDTQSIEFADVERLIHHQLTGGIDGIVIIGTTGESPTLSDQERQELIRFTVQKVGGAKPVIVGTGSNNTHHAVEFTQEADALGADALLVVAPYYNKPTQEGLFLHYSQIAEATSKPILLYSIPSRCGIEIGVPTIQRLRNRYPHIIGIKEASGSCGRVLEIRKALDPDFIILSGDDAATLPFMSIGAKGVISVASNLIVKPLVDMVHHALENDMQQADVLNQRYGSFFKTIFVETNPAPIKEALFQQKIIRSAAVRLPLCRMEPQNSASMKNCLAGLLL